jgi:signal transduction histidine kinase
LSASPISSEFGIVLRNSSSLSGEDPKEVLSYIQDARQCADRLAHLVNDLLDVSRLERRKLTVAP